jgi:phospholipid transport system transporter-binding protein
VLLACRRRALARGQAFAVKGLPAGLASMAQLYGIDALLPASA